MKTFLKALPFLMVLTNPCCGQKYQEYLDFVHKLGTDAVALLTDTSLSDDSRKDQFEVLFSSAFAVELIGRFVLGPYARSSTPEERKIFLPLFKKTISDIYTSRFKTYKDQKLKVKHAKPKGEKIVCVYSTIENPAGEDVLVDWKVTRDKNGNLSITDVVVENISMSIAQKDEFVEIIQRENKGVTGLNQVLETRLKKSGRLKKAHSSNKSM